jgi:hypothetical protein
LRQRTPLPTNYSCFQESVHRIDNVREKGEGRREKGEGRREKGEGRREKGEGRREKGEGGSVGVSFSLDDSQGANCTPV